ncbi:transporter [Aquabacterium sp.]|uniref:transporter n=1 Tax=Aquabacterium sp. TaxID=1872578 RepID=UPI0035ADBFCF
MLVCLLGLLAAQGVSAVEGAALEPAPAAAAPAAAAAPVDARDALAKKEGDVDQAKLLKETLTAADKQYSMLKQGKFALTYDLTYTYIGQQKINAKFTDSTLTLFNIQNTNSHTITNTVSLDYGLRDNLTGTVTLPVVSKYSDSSTFRGMTNAFGDMSVGARWQPFELKRNAPSITTSGTLRLPTGRSPFEVNDGSSVATGSGYTSFTLGVNMSKVIDPVAIFGSLSGTASLPAKNLSQQQDGLILSSVHPGKSFSFGAGFAYALSYDISTTLSFQETISGRTLLKFQDGTSSNTSMQTSSVLNFGLGVRVSPVTTVNFSIGVGLTPDTPDFTMGMNMPLNF